MPSSKIHHSCWGDYIGTGASIQGHNKFWNSIYENVMDIRRIPYVMLDCYRPVPAYVLIRHSCIFIRPFIEATCWTMLDSVPCWTLFHAGLCSMLDSVPCWSLFHVWVTPGFHHTLCMPCGTPYNDILLLIIGIGLIWAELGKVYREQGYVIRGVKAFEKAYNIYKQFYVSRNHPEVSELHCFNQ